MQPTGQGQCSDSNHRRDTEARLLPTCYIALQCLGWIFRTEWGSFRQSMRDQSKSSTLDAQ